MAANALNFAAQVDDWCKKSEARMLAVSHESTQRLVSIAQSRIPRDTGFARASVRASLESMPPIDASKSKPALGSYPYNPGEVVLTIAGAQLGQQIFIGWTANYVGELERGHSQQAPSGFVRVTAMEWPQIVAGVVEDAKARVG